MRLVLVGEGEEADVLTAYVRKRGLSDVVRFLGSRRDVPRLLAAADTFLLSSISEGIPLTIIEAMASEVPIVSTDVGGIPYLLEHERDALLVPPGDDEAMARAVRRVLTEPGLAARLSANGRTKAAQFDWSVVLPLWQTLLAGPQQLRSAS